MAPQPDDSTPAAEVVRIAARAHERDRYLAALLSPLAVRDDLIALAAFAGEIGRIPAFVTEPMMGRLRLQWWRERIEDGGSGGHPIAAAVLQTANRYQLPQTRLVDLIDAHEALLDDIPFANDAAFDAYLQRTHGALFELDQRVRGETPQPGLIAAAAGAYGLARHLIELTATLAQDRVLLPANRLPAGDRTMERLAPLLTALAADARRHLALARASLRASRPPTRQSFLPLALVEPYLRHFERQEPGQETATDLGPLSRVARLWLAHWTGRI